MKLMELINTNGNKALVNPNHFVLVESVDDSLLYFHLSTGYVVKVDTFDNPDIEEKMKELKIKIS